ncbi:hypothetical protein [Paenibacillus polymyxa]|uniref:Phage protein n=1 Tax=Paenibacillus polymyxa TaxID=1406 RepID=A0ABX2ZDJ3_PAEPO|nr:hypothetical protein [Paenibacillus polymyxa]ODA08224.1 hypothetical protein A7312_27855 [Paenibacillus polymyxa]
MKIDRMDGHDWIELNENQKKEMVQQIIFRWKKNDFKVKVGSDYFVEALNSFYGNDITNTEKLTQVIAMIVAAENLITN